MHAQKQNASTSRKAGEEFISFKVKDTKKPIFKRVIVILLLAKNKFPCQPYHYLSWVLC